MPFCQAAELSVRIGRTGAAAGTEWTDLVFTDVGATPCQLMGVPALTFRDGSGAQAAPVNSLATDTSSEPVALAPGVPAGLARSDAAAGQAYLMMGVPSILCLAKPIARIDVALPGGSGHLTTAWVNGPAADTASYCYHGSIAVEGFVTGAPPTPAPEPVPDFVITAALPSSIKLGQTVHYDVMLTNNSGQVLQFATCPGYTESIKGVTSRRYLLNCSSIGAWAPGRSINFAMEFPLAGIGFGGHSLNGQGPLRTTLDWTLDYPHQSSGGGWVYLSAP
jgi:hypothetical protein